MAPRMAFTAAQFLVVLLTFLMVTTPLASEGEPHSPSYVPPSSDHGPGEIWFLNESLAALVKRTKSLLVSTPEGAVEMLHETSVQEIVARWSFSSGPQLSSFRWLKEEGTYENGSQFSAGFVEEAEEGYLSVEEADGSLIARDAFGGTEKLSLSLEELREKSVLVRDGEIIRVDRQITVFLVDAETGVIIRELGKDNISDLYLLEDKKSLFVVRTDYTAKASNLSGQSIWSLTYGEIGTLVTGPRTPKTDMASLQLLPVKAASRSGEIGRIPPLVTRRPFPIAGRATSEQKYLEKAASKPLPLGDDPLGRLALPPAPELSLALPGLAVWADSEYRSDAPGHLPPPKPRSSNSGTLGIVIATVAGFAIFASVGIMFKRGGVKKLPPVNGTPTKKKKGRKGAVRDQENATSDSIDLVAPVGAVNMNSVNRVKVQANYGVGTQVGRLFVTKTMIGSGSHGTLVLEGYLDDRKVAVKRLLGQYYEKAQKEIALLIASDEHPNVVRYYAMEESSDFVYLALERCSFSLHDLIIAQSSRGLGMENQLQECLAGKGLKVRSIEDFKLWDERGRPSAELFQIMRDVVAGLAHLHALGIVHRDLKPHNVLISSGRIMQAKIADMGLSKQLDEDASSFDTHLTAYGSSGSRGWQAPEHLVKKRASRAVDVFSLGCVLFHCISGGCHPFGPHLERDRNIVLGKMDLFPVVDFPEAADLIERLLDPDPLRRPRAQDILLHPFFWDTEKRLTFLKDVSDRVELEIKDSSSTLLADLESLESSVLCGGWDAKLDFALLQNIRGYRRYHFKSVRDLLRVIRNKANHFRELPEALQTLLGPVPDGLEAYFTSRFPRLLIDIYQVMAHHCIGESSFERYFPASYIPKIPLPELE